MDVSQYLEIFIDETKEHLQELNDQVLILENEPDNADAVNEIFRAAHSLKGMAGTMGFKRMQKLTHNMENVFQEVRSGNMGVSPELIDIVFNCLDALEAYLDNIQSTSDEGTDDNEDILARLDNVINGGGAAALLPPIARLLPRQRKLLQPTRRKQRMKNLSARSNFPMPTRRQWKMKKRRDTRFTDSPYSFRRPAC